MKTSTVAIGECETYNIDELEKAVSAVCKAAPFPDVKGKKVLLKANILSDAKPELCITTNPEFVRAIIRFVKSMGAFEVLVGDSPGLHYPSFSAQTCGIGKVCNEEGAVWCDFSKSPDITPIHGTRQKLPLAHVLKETDVIISLPKFKTHQLMMTTGAVKNLFGLVPGLNKSPCHLSNPSCESFARLIAGIHETVKPDFCIMDAVFGMEGPGPADGKPRHVGLIIASDNCFAADYAQLKIMNYDADEIPLINEARRRKIFPETIDYPILKPENLVIKDYKRIPPRKRGTLVGSLILPLIFSHLPRRKESAPEFNAEKCILCKRCVTICPAKALEIIDGKVCIYTKKCIRCYCCHELCPAHAISVKSGS